LVAASLSQSGSESDDLHEGGACDANDETADSDEMSHGGVPFASALAALMFEEHFLAAAGYAVGTTSEAAGLLHPAPCTPENAEGCGGVAEPIESVDEPVSADLAELSREEIRPNLPTIASVTRLSEQVPPRRGGSIGGGGGVPRKMASARWKKFSW